MNSSFYCFQNKKGFTLLEILLVVGIIAVLAGVVIVAINPAKMLAKVRDTQRKVGLSEINKALAQYFIDKGQLPNSLSSELKNICDTGSFASSTQAGIDCAGLIDLSILVPSYIQAIPKDPQISSTISTGYYVGKNSSGNIVLTAPQTEVGSIIVVGKFEDNCSHVATDVNCWSADLGTMAWGPTGVITNASSTTDGKTNTNILKNLIDSYPAANACTSLNQGGYPAGTWYLPSKQQLLDANISGFQSGNYWSSTEDWTPPELPADIAWDISMPAKNPTNMMKYAPWFRVRCLR